MCCYGVSCALFVVCCLSLFVDLCLLFDVCSVACMLYLMVVFVVCCVLVVVGCVSFVVCGVGVFSLFVRRFCFFFWLLVACCLCCFWLGCFCLVVVV